MSGSSGARVLWSHVVACPFVSAGSDAARADPHTAYQESLAEHDTDECDQIRDIVAELDQELRGLGVRGRLAPLDPDPPRQQRSTRRRQDTPDLPRRPVERRTIGQAYAEGKYRPSTFLTVTCESYGRVDGDWAAVDPDSYDYRRAALGRSTCLKVEGRRFEPARDHVA